MNKLEVLQHATLAGMEEHLPCRPDVLGSIPHPATIFGSCHVVVSQRLVRLFPGVSLLTLFILRD